MPPFRYVGTPSQWDIQNESQYDPATLSYLNLILAQNMTMPQVMTLINADLFGYATLTYQANAIAGTAGPNTSPLATPSWTQSQLTSYVPSTTVNRANGPVGLGSSTSLTPGQVSPGLINAASTQQWPSPFWSPTSYQSASVTATSTPMQLFPIAIPYPGYTYTLACFGTIDTQVAADDGTFAEVLVCVGSTSGQIIAFGYGCGESYTGPTPGTVPSQAFLNNSSSIGTTYATIPGWTAYNTGGYVSTVAGNYLQVTQAMTATLSASIVFSGPSYATYSVQIVNSAGAVIVTGAGVSGVASGTCTANWTGSITSGQLYTVQGIANYTGGTWVSGTLTIIPNQVTSSSMVNIIPVPFEDQSSLTAATTLYVMLASSSSTAVTASTFNPGLWVMPIPWAAQIAYSPIAVAFDAVGAGASGNLSATTTWLHTAVAGAYVIVMVSVDRPGPVSSATYGGTTMVALGSITNPNGANGTTYLQCYGLRNVPGGSQTVAVIGIPASSWGAANSVSYLNVASVSTAQTALTATAANSDTQTVLCSQNQMIVQAFSGESSAGTASTVATGGTNRYNGSASGHEILTISDAVQSTTFGAATTSNYFWSSLAVVLSSISYDNSAGSGWQSSIPSATAFTWSHTAASGPVGPYAIVLIAGGDSGINLSAAATVRFGNTTLTSLGSVYSNNDTSSASGWLWVFGANNVAGGPQTVSVTLTQSGHAFSGYGASYTYNNVSSVGSLQTSFGSSTTGSLSVPTAVGGIVWGAIAANEKGEPSSFSLTQRQAGETNQPVFISGDGLGVPPSVPINVTVTSSAWSAVGLNLL